MVEARIVVRELFGERQDFSGVAFQPFRPGVEIFRIYGDGTSGPAAALLRYAPGARVPAHDHPGYEHIVVLQGGQSDQNGRYGAGTCLISGPGSSHAVASEEGCVVLAIWNTPVVFR